MIPPNKPCLKCGAVHWQHLPCPGAKARTSLLAAVRVPVEPTPRPYPQSRVKALEAEVERLEAEVHRLKRELAKAHADPAVPVTKSQTIPVTRKKRGRPPKTGKALSGAERVRKWRQSKAAALKGAAP